MIEVDTEQTRVLYMLLTPNRELAEPNGLR
jgi:hypothetical protein